MSQHAFTELPADLKNCGIQKHSKSFAFASKLLSPSARADVHALYQLFRGMDDLADGCCNSHSALKMFESLRAALEANRSHVWLTSEHQVAIAKLDPIGQRALLRLLDTLRADLTPACIENEEQLLHYCFGAAGTVGLVLLPALGVADERARTGAAALGIAMQLTNIARDVVEDARMGRRYLPQTYFAAVPDLAAIAAAEPNALRHCVPAVARVIALADAFYDLAFDGCRWIPLRNRLAVISAARIYRQIGWDIASGLDRISFSKRVSVSGFSKLSCVAMAAIDVLKQGRASQESATCSVSSVFGTLPLAAVLQQLLSGMWSGSEPCPSAIV
jgi:15-cis-phytoene synthase